MKRVKHVQSAITVFELLREKAQVEAGDGAQGTVTAGRKCVKEAGAGASRDTSTGASLAKAARYEIVSYKDLVLGDEELGNGDAVSLPRQNLPRKEQTALEFERNAPSC